jgi:hypothetical protein
VLPGNRNACGSRTAWLRPFMNNFAISNAHLGLFYDIYQ